MAGPEKRIPGQSNADYERRQDPNANFFGTQSLQGGGDLSFVIRASQAFSAWRSRRKDRKSS